MNIENLSFYDGYGKPLNFKYDETNSVWTGSLHYKEISVALFDTINLLMVEFTNDTPYYPTLTTNDEIKFYWKEAVDEDERAFFLYSVSLEDETNIPYINIIDDHTITYNSNLTNAGFPIQTNIAFNPYDDQPVERVLYATFNGIKFLELTFYGVGEMEDYRFQTWLTNFGIKLHADDAVVVADYDIKEGKPDWVKINDKRKELLVNKEEYFPYVGSYVGLLNMIEIFGYSDILEVKEYLKKRNLDSPEYNDYTLFSINELLERGTATVYNQKSVSLNRTTDDLHDMYRKTGLLALTYKFTIDSGDTDENGLPVVTSTTDDTPNEVFYKLHRLKQILEKDYLPTNVMIRDIVGEYIFFNNYIIKNWKDDIDIKSYQYQQELTITISPVFHRDVVDLSIFRKQTNSTNLVYPRDTINNSNFDFVNRSQMWTPEENAALVAIIGDYYELVKPESSTKITSELSWEDYADYDTPLGCPVIFSLGFEQLTAMDYTNVITGDLNDYYTAYNIEYRNIYEVEWRILKEDDQPYDFNIRGTVEDYRTLAHILPTTGTYSVQIIGYDFMGGYSNQWELEITIVNNSTPEIYTIIKVPDKFTDDINKLGNTAVMDYEGSTTHGILINSLNKGIDNPDIQSYDLSWYNFQKNIKNYRIFEPTSKAFVYYKNSTNEYKKYLGVYSDFTTEIYNFDTVNEVNHVNIDEYLFQDDYVTGWKFIDPTEGDIITFNETITYEIPAFTDLGDLVSILNSEENYIISKYIFIVMHDDVTIKAQARDISDQKLMFISYTSSTMTGDEFSFGVPEIYTDVYMTKLESTFPEFKREYMMLDAPMQDKISGAVGSIDYWIEGGYIHMEYDDTTGWEYLGDLPSMFYRNYFDLNKIKAFKHGMIVPKYVPVFFVINNIPGKVLYEWTIYDTEREFEVIRVSGVPFLMWTFSETSTYDIRVKITDSNNNQFTKNLSDHVHVYNSNDYIDYIEKELTLRMKNI